LYEIVINKRLTKKSRKGFRGWPMATIAFYGPDLSRASKAAVAIMETQDGEPTELRSWQSDSVDVRHDSIIGEEILNFIEGHDVKSVTMSGGIIGCPHQEGIDYEGEWCPLCSFWKGRDRFTGKLLY
jgi:hypothetical protein